MVCQTLIYLEYDIEINEKDRYEMGRWHYHELLNYVKCRNISIARMQLAVLPIKLRMFYSHYK